MAKRKDKGMLDQFLPAMVVIVLLAVLWAGSMVCASQIDKSSDIRQVGRTYLLKMETDGYLTEENRILLLADLAALGMEQIDLSGTTFTDVGYGNRIHLVIRGVVQLTDLDYKGFASPLFTTRQAGVSIKKISVAKN